MRLSLLRPWSVCASVVLAACGGSSSLPPADPAPTTATTTTAAAPANTEKACELLTKADAEAALGAPIRKSTDESRPEPIGDKILRGFCFYNSAAGSVSMTVNKHIDAAYAAQSFGEFKKRYEGTESYRALSGLGDDAFAEEEQLLVRRGDLILFIELKREGPGKLKHYGDKPGLEALATDERKIAVTALSRLPAGRS